MYEYLENHSLTQDKLEQVHMQFTSHASQQFPDSICPQFTPRAPGFSSLPQSNTVVVSTPKVSIRDSRGYSAPQHPTCYVNSHESSLRLSNETFRDYWLLNENSDTTRVSEYWVTGIWWLPRKLLGMEDIISECDKRPQFNCQREVRPALKVAWASPKESGQYMYIMQH